MNSNKMMFTFAVAAIAAAVVSAEETNQLRTSEHEQGDESEIITAGIIASPRPKAVACHSLCGFAKKDLGDEPWACLEDCKECVGDQTTNKQVVKKCFCARQVNMKIFQDEADCLEGTKIFTADFPTSLLN